MILSRDTVKRVELFIKKPTHSLIIFSESRKSTEYVIELIIRSLLKKPNSYNIDNYPYLYKVSKDKTMVSIDDIKALIKRFNSKSPSSNEFNKFGIVYDGEALSDPAQSALLKTLEEPPSGSLIILVTRSMKNIKPTILSRSQLIKITNPTLDQFSEEYSKNNIDSETLKKHYSYSKGNIDDIASNIEANFDFSSDPNLLLIRKFLNTNRFERLNLINEFCSDRPKFTKLLSDLKSLLNSSMNNAISHKNDPKVWIKYLDAVHRANEANLSGVNIKLLYTNLCLSL